MQEDEEAKHEKNDQQINPLLFTNSTLQYGNTIFCALNIQVAMIRLNKNRNW